MIRHYYERLFARLLRVLRRECLAGPGLLGPAEMRQRIDGIKVASLRRARFQVRSCLTTRQPTTSSNRMLSFVVSMSTQRQRAEFASLVEFLRSLLPAGGCIGYVDSCRIAILWPGADAALVDCVIEQISLRWDIDVDAYWISECRVPRWQGQQRDDQLRRRSSQVTVGRTSEAIVAAIALVLFSPILLLLAVSVKISSPGPIFCIDHRRGRGGRMFRVYRFRARAFEPMVAVPVGYERSRSERDDSSPGTPRLTSIGSFLHESRLERLPQLWNIVRGDLSF